MLILASGSPRREELLRRLGVAFEITTAGIDEAQQPGEPPIDLVQRLAREKALAVADRYPDQPVLGADTIVVLDGEVLGKPVDGDDAAAMLRRLRGQPHTVWSAVYTCHPALGRTAAALNETTVWMRAYSDGEIAAYVASGDPMDKAGGYAIQHAGFAPVERLAGCYSGVMGFPLGEVVTVLRAIGVEVPGDAAAACQLRPGDCCQSIPASPPLTPAA